MNRVVLKFSGIHLPKITKTPSQFSKVDNGTSNMEEHSLKHPHKFSKNSLRSNDYS